MIKPVYLMAVLLAVTAPSSVVFAQTPVPAGHILRSTKEKPESPTQGAPVLPDVKQADERPAMSLGEDIKITVNAFTVLATLRSTARRSSRPWPKTSARNSTRGPRHAARKGAPRVYAVAVISLPLPILPREDQAVSSKSPSSKVALAKSRFQSLRVQASRKARLGPSSTRISNPAT